MTVQPGPSESLPGRGAENPAGVRGGGQAVHSEVFAASAPSLEFLRREGLYRPPGSCSVGLLLLLFVVHRLVLLFRDEVDGSYFNRMRVQRSREGHEATMVPKSSGMLLPQALPAAPATFQFTVGQNLARTPGT
jgi:hypothetical protein